MGQPRYFTCDFVAEPLVELRRLKGERVEMDQDATLLDRGAFDQPNEVRADSAPTIPLIDPELLQLARGPPPSSESTADKHSRTRSRA